MRDDVNPGEFTNLVLSHGLVMGQAVVRQLEASTEPHFWVLNHMKKELNNTIGLVCAQMALCKEGWSNGIISKQFTWFNHVFK